MTLVLDLANEEEAALNAKAQAEGLSVEKWSEQWLKQALQPINGVKTIGEKIAEIWSDVPPEVWDTMPTDGASEHDHYIYGLPKRNE